MAFYRCGGGVTEKLKFMWIGLTGSDNNPFNSSQYRAYGLWDVSKCKKVKIQRYGNSDWFPYGLSNSLPSNNTESAPGTFTVDVKGGFESSHDGDARELETQGYKYLYVCTRTDWRSGYAIVEAIE